MKQLTILLAAIFVCLTAVANDKGPLIQFEQTTQDFGTLHQGDPQAAIEFKFTNVGDAPLVIVSANSSCGCTRPHFPDEPIAPGKSGVITLNFNPKNQLGEISKSVSLRTNSRNGRKSTLRITGIVVE